MSWAQTPVKWFSSFGRSPLGRVCNYLGPLQLYDQACGRPVARIEERIADRRLEEVCGRCMEDCTVISAMRMGGGRGGPCFHMGTGVAWEIPSHMGQIIIPGMYMVYSTDDDISRL
jgi:hypothetical protein